MCAIIGALSWSGVGNRTDLTNTILMHIWGTSHERGRDGRGYAAITQGEPPYGHQDTSRVELGHKPLQHEFFNHKHTHGVMIGNLRAEPTTEYVAHKKLSDQQPYHLGGWCIVHNGTIANDKALRTGRLPTAIDSAAIVEHLKMVERNNPWMSHEETFIHTMRDLKGSFAILAFHEGEPGRLYTACNYRPIWFAKNHAAAFFASSEEYFPHDLVQAPVMLKPYTINIFDHNGITCHYATHQLTQRQVHPGRALVVCSGGLDSVVAATYVKRVLGFDIELIHFMYGSRAQRPEVRAVQEVGAYLGAPVTLFPLPVYKPGDSPLLDPHATVAGGEQGAEFAHEWVPARNLLLLAVATAYAEANGYEIIVLGNNLEEAGAYPDNEPEFIRRFNAMLPFAVGDGKAMEVMMPVGNMMKHEIVRLGLQYEAPMHLTWSCYRAGAVHCGTCGPCHMRRTAFQINNAAEVIPYAVPVN